MVCVVKSTETAPVGGLTNAGDSEFQTSSNPPVVALNKKSWEEAQTKGYSVLVSVRGLVNSGVNSGA